MPAFNAKSTVPLAIAATGSETRCSSCFSFFLNRFFNPLHPIAEPINAAVGCFSHPSENIDDKKYSSNHNYRNAGNKKCTANNTEVFKISRQGPVQRIERCVM